MLFLLTLLAASYKAVQWTLQNLYREGDVLHLLHVVPTSCNTHVTGGFGLGATLPPEEGLQVHMLHVVMHHMYRQTRWLADAGSLNLCCTYSPGYACMP